MSSKKKPRPQFDVPTDIESGRESGWVYRSAVNSEHVEEPRAENIAATSSADVDSNALTLGFAAFAQTIALGLAIAAIPLTIGLRLMRAFRSE